MLLYCCGTAKRERGASIHLHENRCGAGWVLAASSIREVLSSSSGSQHALRTHSCSKCQRRVWRSAVNWFLRFRRSSSSSSSSSSSRSDQTPSPGSSIEDPNQENSRLGGSRPHALLVVLCRAKVDRPRADHGRNIETNAEYRVCLFPTTVPAAVWLFCRRPKHTTDDDRRRNDDDNDPRHETRLVRDRAPVPCVDCVGSVHGGAVVLVCSSRARARSCGVSHREAHRRFKHKPPQRRGGMWLGIWDVPRGTGRFRGFP